MKICTYRYQDSFLTSKRLGILIEGNKIIDPALCWAAEYEREGHYNPFERGERKIPTSLHTLLRTCENPIELLQESYGIYLFLEKIGVLETLNGTPICFELEENSNISLDCPLDKFTSYRDFYAHEKHVEVGFKKRGETIPAAWYEIPAYYKGATCGFIGHRDEILWPSYTDVLDYELELGMVVGRDGINIREDHALDHIFGFTILNDISARDIQKKEMAIKLGPAKGKDFCTVLGPVIVTIDEFDGIEPNLLMTAKINGKEWSRGYSGDAHFNFAQMITHVSQDEWVLAGDLFGSGTVGTGCGLELDRWIKPGDTIDLSIQGIGNLKNKVGYKK